MPTTEALAWIGVLVLAILVVRLERRVSRLERDRTDHNVIETWMEPPE